MGHETARPRGASWRVKRSIPVFIFEGKPVMYFSKSSFIGVVAFACTLLSSATLRADSSVGVDTLHGTTSAQSISVPPPVPRIVNTINPAIRSTLKGNTNRYITSGQLIGTLPGDSQL